MQPYSSSSRAKTCQIVRSRQEGTLFFALVLCCCNAAYPDIRRWEREEGIRFLKSQVNLERIRTFRWSAICRLVLLAVLIMIYLGCLVEGHPSICDRLVYLSQPLPDNPDFLLYRLLGGLTEAINTCFWLHKDLLRRSLRENPRFYEVLLIFSDFCDIIYLLRYIIERRKNGSNNKKNKYI